MTNKFPRYIIRYDRIDGWHILDRYTNHPKRSWFSNEWMAMHWAINDGEIDIRDIDFSHNL